MHKRGLRTGQARGLEKVERADSVDIKIVKRPAGGQVMAGLGGSMNDGGGFQLFEEIHHALPVANIQFVMLEIGKGLFESLEIPTGIALGAKEIGAHIIIHAMDAPSLPGKISDNFASNQAA